MVKPDYTTVENTICLLSALRTWQTKIMHSINNAKGNVEKENIPVPFLNEMYREKVLLCDIPRICNYIESLINYRGD